MGSMNIYDYNPKDHVRVVLFDSNNRYIPIFWFEIGLDGSIYFGIRRKNPPILKKSRKILNNSQVTFSFEEGDIITDERYKKNIKVSYHASGIVNLFDSRFTSDKLRDLNDVKLISFLLFEKLINFPLIAGKKIGKKDIILHYKDSPNHPLVGQLYVMPNQDQISDMKPIIASDAISQKNLCFICKDLVNCNNYLLQLVLYSHKLGPWPPYNYIVMKE